MQAELQRKIRGRIGQGEIADQTLTERIEAIKGNVLALEHELHELIDEMSWKDWTVGPPFINRDAAVKEGVDALHFLVNIFLHLDVTPAELLELYTAKNAVNHRRQDTGYDGVTTKCTGCGRALEDISLTQVHSDDGALVFLCPCGKTVDTAVALSVLGDD